MSASDQSPSASYGLRLQLPAAASSPRPRTASVSSSQPLPAPLGPVRPPSPASPTAASRPQLGLIPFGLVRFASASAQTDPPRPRTACLGPPSASDRSPWRSASDSSPSASDCSPRPRIAPLRPWPLLSLDSPSASDCSPRPRTAPPRPWPPLSLGPPSASDYSPRPRTTPLGLSPPSASDCSPRPRTAPLGLGSEQLQLPAWANFSMQPFRGFTCMKVEAIILPSPCSHLPAAQPLSPLSLCCAPGPESSPRTILATVVLDHLAPGHGFPRFQH